MPPSKQIAYIRDYLLDKAVEADRKACAARGIYEAKESGGSNYATFNPALSRKAHEEDGKVALEAVIAYLDFALCGHDISASSKNSPGPINLWKEAIHDALIVNHQYITLSLPPTMALRELIKYETELALDPSVSFAAAQLKEAGAQEMLSRIRASVQARAEGREEGGDSVIMEAIDNIAALHITARRED